MPKAKATKAAKVQPIDKLAPVTFITSGVPEIDELIGGFPRGRITEIYGAKSVGKSSLMFLCLSALVGKAKVLYVDVENAINIERLRHLEAVSADFDASTEYVLEKVADLTTEAVEANKYDVIIIDSVAALVTETELAGDMGAANIGVKARLMGQWMRRVVGPLGDSKTAMVFINQWRESPQPFAPRFRPGGKALPYASSLGMELKSAKKDRDTKGQVVHVIVEKNKLGQPYIETQFKLFYKKT